MEAMEDLEELGNSIAQASAILADEEVDESTPTSHKRSSFLNVIALGNVGAGKSAVLNSLIGHPVLPTGENGATRAPISIDLSRDISLRSHSISYLVDNRCQQVSASFIRRSLQERLSKGTSGKKENEIRLKLCTSTAPTLKLVDLPGLDQRVMDESKFWDYIEHNDAVLLVVIPATQAPEVSSSRALRIAKEYDAESTRTVGIITKIDQAASESKALAAVQALLLGQGPPKTSDIPWVALIGQSVSIASAQASAPEDSLETAWRAESESLKTILTGAPENKLGRIALVNSLADQILNRMKLRLPNLLSGLHGKYQLVQNELARLGEQMIDSVEGTRALALKLCREFEDEFLLHLTGGEGNGWKVVASFKGSFPNRMKELPLDRHFDLNNVKRVVLEADGYQPYLISPEKGLRSLIKGFLELAKEPSCLCVDEVHRVLMDLVSTAANGTRGLGRYPSFRREVISVASGALENYKSEAKKMVVALVDMERAFVPPQHFIRLVQRRMDRQRREDDLKNRPSKRPGDGEQSLLSRAISPLMGNQQSGEIMKVLKDKSNQGERESQEVSSVKTGGPAGEMTFGFLLKKSGKSNDWNRRWFVLNEKSGKLGYTKRQEERHFRGVINLEECNIEDISEEEEGSSKSSKDKKSNTERKPSLVFKITSRVPYKTVLKAHSSVLLKTENVTEKNEWLNKLRNVIQSKGGQFSGESGHPIRQSFSDGSLDGIARRPTDPEEELRWMSQEVRGYVEAVLNSLAANVPKAVVLCQVEKAREDMLKQLYSCLSSQATDKIEELLQEDHNAKLKRDRIHKQSSLLSKLTRFLSIHDTTSTDLTIESTPNVRESSLDEWRRAFDSADMQRSHSRRNSDPSQNSDASFAASGSRRTPTRLPPPPPYRFF